MTSEPLPRHTPTLFNLAWSETFFWDGRALSLEEQAAGPLLAKAEMGMTAEALVKRLSQNESYQQDFNRVFPDKGLSLCLGIPD